jgi:hypothetical protein
VGEEDVAVMVTSLIYEHGPCEEQCVSQFPTKDDCSHACGQSYERLFGPPLGMNCTMTRLLSTAQKRGSTA